MPEENNIPEDDKKNQEEISEKSNCEECQKLKDECEEYKKGWQRALADYQNLQKEMNARRSELLQMSEREILEEFIPVFDNFKKAFNHHPDFDESDESGKKIKNWSLGIGHIMRQFKDILKAHQVEEIKTIGEKFDPKFHEAVGEETVADKEAGIILREIDGGYILGNRVLKVAKVIIGN